MFRSINRHCLTLLSATLLSSSPLYGFVEKDKAQIINPSKTIPGAIISLDKIHSVNTGMPGMKMILSTADQKQLLVHLSAEWILLSKRLSLSAGDRIIVTGPLIKSGNQAALVAKSIKKGKQKIALTPKVIQ